MKFERAVKSATKLRLAVSGPSGSGKTYSALAVAEGLGERIALIDSERRSASKYGSRFQFDTVDLQKKSVDEYIEAIHAAASAGYDVLIIDSLSHAWESLLDEVDRIAKAKFRGNTFSAWSEGTPKQRKLVDAIVSYPGHVIATMRAKTEYVLEDGKGGKSKPTRVGTSPEQRKGIEYEFDMLMELSIDHVAVISKDRTEKFQDQCIEKPGREFGKALAAWLADGAPPKPPPGDEEMTAARAAIAAAPDLAALQKLTSLLARFSDHAKAELRELYKQRTIELRPPGTVIQDRGAPPTEETDGHPELPPETNPDEPWAKYAVPAA